MERLTIYLALAAVLVGIASAASCYDCWYWSLTSADDNCNSASEFHKVENETCTGKCYTTTYVLHGSMFVGRGCKEDCKDGETTVDNVPGIDAMRKCCVGDHCNNEIVSSAFAARASVPIYALCAAAAAFFLIKLK